MKKFTNDPVFFDELLSEGVSCLLNAVEKFDYSRGFRFSTYATRAVSRDLFRAAQRRHRDLTRFVSGGEQGLDVFETDNSVPQRVTLEFARQLNCDDVASS